MTKILSHGTPQRIIRDNQSFQLVALIEGAGANAQFMQNLQVVGQQRHTLGELRAKLAALPKTAPASEGESLSAQIADLDGRLTKNLEFMAKHYGYSVQHNYLLAPVQSALLLKALDADGKPLDDESKATLIAEFHTTEAYEELQALRQRAVTTASTPEKASELAAIHAELKEKFGFEADQHYLLQVRKGALYATVAA